MERAPEGDRPERQREGAGTGKSEARPGAPRADAGRPPAAPRPEGRPDAARPEAGRSDAGRDYSRSGPPRRPRYEDADFGGMDDRGMGPGGERRRYTQISADRNRCRFCREKTTRVDYKDVLTLQKLCTNQGRIFSRKRSGNCAEHQRQVKNAIKQARYIGLLSYTV